MNYSHKVVFDEVSDSYYAVPEGHPWVKGFRIERPTVPMDPEDTERDDIEPVPEDLPDDFIELSDDDEEAAKILAIRHVLDEWRDDFGVTSYSEDRIESGRREWLVVTDERADELWEEDLDNYLDECVLGELPETARNYFDREKWKRDARIDGRAHSLNRYDGDEDCAHVLLDDGLPNSGGVEVTYYIYRQN